MSQVLHTAAGKAFQPLLLSTMKHVPVRFCSSCRIQFQLVFMTSSMADILANDPDISKLETTSDPESFDVVGPRLQRFYTLAWFLDRSDQGFDRKYRSFGVTSMKRYYTKQTALQPAFLNDFC